jgi:hypothetical protein
MRTKIIRHSICLSVILLYPLLADAQGGMGSGESGQVGIGIASPAASAKLEVYATNKGFLMPRVTLTGTSDAGTISSPATGLIVYNTATAGSSPSNVTPGFYYYDGTKWQRCNNQQPDATISFDKATPTTSGVAFTPSVTQNPDYVYISSVDGSQWTWNGSAYVLYAPIPSSPWYLEGGTTDAGAGKSTNIYRTGKLGIGTANPTTTVEVGTTDGSVSGELVLNPKSYWYFGGKVLFKRSVTGSTKDWVMEQYMGQVESVTNPRFRIYPSGDETLGIAIMENGKVAINPLSNYTSQTEELLVNGTARITENLNAGGGFYATAGSTSDQWINKGGSPKVLYVDDISDPNNWWNNSASNTFQPTVAGYYFISAMANWQADAAADGSMELYIYKNTSDVVSVVTDKLPTKTSTTQLVTGVVYLNGSTDYIQIRVLNSDNGSSPSMKITGGQLWTKAEAYKIN